MTVFLIPVGTDRPTQTVSSTQLSSLPSFAFFTHFTMRCAHFDHLEFFTAFDFANVSFHARQKSNGLYDRRLNGISIKNLFRIKMFVLIRSVNLLPIFILNDAGFAESKLFTLECAIHVSRSRYESKLNWNNNHKTDAFSIEKRSNSQD